MILLDQRVNQALVYVLIQEVDAELGLQRLRLRDLVEHNLKCLLPDGLVVVFAKPGYATVLLQRTNNELGVSILDIQHLGSLVAGELEIKDHDLQLEALLQADTAEVIGADPRRCFSRLDGFF